MEYIIASLKLQQEDRPNIVITRDDIKACIEIYIEKLIDEIEKELEKI